jgi:MerR family transcriptional regulator/heat shock protein HspR
MNRFGEASRVTRAAGVPDGGGSAAPAGSAAHAGSVASGAGSDSARAVYVISVAAELGGVHPQTLRIYERKGLLDPARTGGGNRRYSDEDIAQLRRIQLLTAAGINLEGVRRILVLEEELERLVRELDRVRAEASEAVDRAHRHYRRDLVPVIKSRLPAKWRG